jgi:hypothetical protein
MGFSGLAFDQAVRELLSVSSHGDLRTALGAYLTGELSPKQFELRVKRALAEWQTGVISAVVSGREKDSYVTAWMDVTKYLTPIKDAVTLWGVDENTLRLMVACAQCKDRTNKALRNLRETSAMEMERGT